MSGIYISYRPVESLAFAQRLYKALSERYGQDKIFYDRKTGLDFVRDKANIIDSCDVLLVIFGRFFRASKSTVGLFLTDEMRREISTALTLNKIIIPILIDGVEMPNVEYLPEEIRAIIFLHAIKMSDDQWDESFSRLIRHLDASFPFPERKEKSASPRDLKDFLDNWMTIGQLEEPGAQNKASASISHQIFVSHADEDRAFVEAVVAKLEEEDNFRCWVSYRDIRTDVPAWSGALVGAIAASKLMIVVVSSHALASKHVLREVTIADNKNIPFIAFCMDKTPLPDNFDYFFSISQRLHADQKPQPEALTLLTSAVKKHAAVSD